MNNTIGIKAGNVARINKPGDWFDGVAGDVLFVSNGVACVRVFDGHELNVKVEDLKAA